MIKVYTRHLIYTFTATSLIFLPKGSKEVAMSLGAAIGVLIGGGLQEVRMKTYALVDSLVDKDWLQCYIYVFAQELCWLMLSC